MTAVEQVSARKTQLGAKSSNRPSDMLMRLQDVPLCLLLNEANGKIKNNVKKWCIKLTICLESDEVESKKQENERRVKKRDNKKAHGGARGVF